LNNPKQNKFIKAFFSEMKKNILKVKKTYRLMWGGQKFLAPCSILARYGTAYRLSIIIPFDKTRF
jgi:hypothetical protein